MEYNVNNRKFEIMNAEAKKELDLSILKYREAVIKLIKENPDLVDKIIDKTQMTENELFLVLKGYSELNVTDLDFILKYTLDCKLNKLSDEQINPKL